MMELRSFSWSATGEREQAGDDAEMEAAKLLDVRRLRSELRARTIGSGTSDDAS